MRSLITLFFIFSLSMGHAQTKELSNAKDYFKAFVNESKSVDLEKASQWIDKAVLIDDPATNAETQFYLGLITKQSIETFKLTDKSNLIIKATDALLKSYNLKREAEYKKRLLTILQILGYDLYESGINLFKENKNDLAYQSYKKIIDIQKVLAENQLNFDMVSPSGQKTALSNQDIMNNLAVFCMNSGKKEEARALFEQEVKMNPSPAAYAKLIQLCQQLGDTSSIDKFIQEGFKRYPKDEDLLIMSINRNLDKKKNQLALDLIDTAIKLKANPKLYLVKAQIFESTAEFDKAEVIYRTGLSLYPKDFDLNYNLGSSIFNNGLRELNKQTEISHKKGMDMVKEARDLFMKAKEINPTKTDIDKILTQVDSVK
jgi:tetratricopeptide (TPR) repeat protein